MLWRYLWCWLCWFYPPTFLDEICLRERHSLLRKCSVSSQRSSPRLPTILALKQTSLNLLGWVSWTMKVKCTTIMLFHLSLSLSSDGCASEPTPFNPSNTNEQRTLTWAEAAIGATATSPCPCGGLEIGRVASRVCMGNFSTRGEWGETDYSNCEFTEKTWQLCDGIQVGGD